MSRKFGKQFQQIFNPTPYPKPINFCLLLFLLFFRHIGVIRLLQREVISDLSTELTFNCLAYPGAMSTMGVGSELLPVWTCRLIVLNLKICLNIGFFTPLKFWQPRGDANMRRRIWKTFPIFLSCLTKWNFKLQLLPVERRFVHNTFFGIIPTCWLVTFHYKYSLIE